MLIRVIQISARGKRPAFAKATAWLTTDVTDYDCRGSRVGCSVINAGVTPIRLRSGQALPLQLNYLGANEATIFSKRGSPRNRYCLI